MTTEEELLRYHQEITQEMDGVMFSVREQYQKTLYQIERDLEGFVAERLKEQTGIEIGDQLEVTSEWLFVWSQRNINQIPPYPVGQRLLLTGVRRNPEAFIVRTPVSGDREAGGIIFPEEAVFMKLYKKGVDDAPGSDETNRA